MLSVQPKNYLKNVFFIRKLQFSEAVPGIFESTKETRWTRSNSLKLSFIWKTLLLTSPQYETTMQSDGYRQKEIWGCIP